MTTIKVLSTLSLALAMMGGALVLTPSSATAGTVKKANSGFISNPALGHNNIPCNKRNGTDKNCRIGAPANPPPKMRPCLKIQRCRG